MTRPLRGAIIGFGAVAEHGHLSGWQAEPRCTIAAVVDPSPDRRNRALELIPAVRAYADVDVLLTAESLDFVDIASPPAFHALAIATAARRGLHILCEKPLVTSVAEYAPVRAAVERSGCVLYPVHNWKHAAGFRALEQLGDRLGAPRELRFRVERNGWSVSAGDWRADRHIGGGGILVDHGWHTFYLALHLAQSLPRRVRATLGRRRYLDADVEDTAHCEIDFKDCRARIDLTWAGQMRCTEWEVIGANARAVLRDDVLRVDDGTNVTERQLAESLSAGSHHPEWFPRVVDSFVAEIAASASQRCGQREAETCLAILAAAYASAAADGAPIDIEQVAP